MIRKEIEYILTSVIHKLYGNIKLPKFSVEVSLLGSGRDYATNVGLLLSETVKKNPIEIAGAIADILKESPRIYPEFEKVGVAHPGFVNMSLKNDFLIQLFNNMISIPVEKLGTSDFGKGKTAIVEYFQLNVAKPPHVGHLRSAVIGDTIKRLFISQGYKTISDSHLGDWGTQFGFILFKYKNLVPHEQALFMGDTNVSAVAYADIVEKSEHDPEVRELSKKEFAKLEQGDKENREIWRGFVETTMKEFERSVMRLGLLPFDEHKGESSYEKDMLTIVKYAIEKGIVKQKDDGAIVVDLTNEKLDEAVLIKSDGASTYLLRDLATLKYRKEHWKFWKNVYVVDVRQSHHFKQVFRVAELLGIEGVGESEHIDFGFMSLPSGPISTRKGTAILLNTVLNEAEKRALTVIEEKNPGLPSKNDVAKKIGLGALKYFDLSHHRKSDIVFDWENALSFEGNTGPYLQYTYARLRSILRKTGSIELKYSIEPDLLEHYLIIWILRLQEAIEDSLKDFTPNTLANYVYVLAQLANTFYHSHPVIQQEDEASKISRLTLVSAMANTLFRGLDLLGIEAPEEM